MKEIFEQYGGVLITVAAVLSVILVITAVVGTDSNSIIGQAFSGLIESFIQKANVNAGVQEGLMELGKEYFGPLWKFWKKTFV